jgi:FAD/FMN-containing dehydrogenase/Fe-S oxidoreductase
VTPLAVARIHSEEHVVLVTEICSDEGVSIHPRGGGSGLAGGALGEGVILDFSQLNRIKTVNKAGGTVDVEAGLVCEELSKRLAPLGLMFAPDPSSADTCQIGGMLANNSSGTRSVKYGTTADHVAVVDVLLPDGNRFQLKDLKVGSPEFDQLLTAYNPFNTIYKILVANSDLIRAKFPRLKKNSSGYNLLSVVDKLDEGIFSLPRLFVGSEGTLGIFLGARLRVVAKPSRKITLQVLFRSLDDVGDAVAEILPTNPAALELIDGSSLDLIGREEYGIPADADAMLLVEFDEEPFAEKVEITRQVVSKQDLVCSPIAESDPEKVSALWKARKAIVPILYRYPGRAKPFGFIEDVELPTERVSEFIRFASQLFEAAELPAGIYGHIGDGNLHIRPVLDLSTSGGLKMARRIYEQVYEMAISLNGSITSEHGDGRLRAPMVESLYGPELYRIFRKIHFELNPERSVNPDVKLSTVEFTEKFDFEKVTRQCASCGKCNHYCPAYDVYSTEEMSARGWVRIMLTSDYNYKNVKHLIDGCLNCKNCHVVCPAGVDVSRYVTERRSEKKSRVARRIFDLQQKGGDFDKWVRRFGKMTAMIDNPPARFLMDATSWPFVHLDRKRILPSYVKKALPERYPELVEKESAEVAYFHGCADKMLDLGSGPAAIEVLQKAGYSVCLPEQYCCGMPQQTYGFFEYEREFARRNIDSLLRFDSIITTCATCLGELLHYPELLEDDAEYSELACKLADRCYDITEFLWKRADLRFGETKNMRRVAFHQPCHLREVGRVDETHLLIESLPGITLIPMRDADRCCGAAGTYNVFQYENSMTIFERKKRGFLDSGAELVVSSCPTCVLQFIDGLKAPDKVLHVVELINDSMV